MNHAISLIHFQKQLLRCFQGSLPSHMMLALSGGVDSMCLAYLLSQFKKQVSPHILISAATIDHGFRQESAIEAKKVSAIVRPWGITHYTEKLHYQKDVHSISNFEEVARNLRYEVLRGLCKDQGINALLVAHNQNDRVETFIQRLQMNSTMYGMLGLREKAPFPVADSSPDEKDRIFVYRPLLHFGKQSVRETCRSHSVPWFEDVSNQDVHLTERNLLRYMINEYVPQVLVSRPELKCLTQESLKTTMSEVKRVLERYEAQKLHLKSIVETYSFDALIAEIKFTIPFCNFEEIQPPVLARWLFELIHPLSSAKHFHWSYAKLERQAMPRIWEWLKTPSKVLQMTYLNVSFDVRLNGQNVDFYIRKQPPQRDVVRNLVLKVKAGDSSWHLFDRIWWMKIGGIRKDVLIRYVNASATQALSEAFPGFLADQTSLRRKIGFEPIVMGIDGLILAFPTLGLVRDGVSVYCKLKATL